MAFRLKESKKFKEAAICAATLVLIVAAFIVDNVKNRAEVERLKAELTEFVRLEESGVKSEKLETIKEELELTFSSADLTALISTESNTMSSHESAFAKLKQKKQSKAVSTDITVITVTAANSSSQNELTSLDAELDALAKSQQKNTTGGFLRGIQRHSSAASESEAQDNTD